MKIQNYVKKHWDELPKSTINEIEVVIFDVVNDYDGGWGHHDYSAFGVLKDGTAVEVSSSGCSCNGSCGVDAIDFKVSPEKSLTFEKYNPKVLDFASLQTALSDY